MKSLFRIRQNQSGVILVTVILLTIALSIVAIGIMSITISHVKSGTSVVDTIKAEQLATGRFYLQHQAVLDGVNLGNDSETLDTRTFTVTSTINNGSSGPNQTNQVDVSINY